MESKESRTCAICRQTKHVQSFPKTPHEKGLSPQTSICLACRAAYLANTDTEDEGGSGGKQLQHSRNAEQLQYEMELEAALQQALKDLNDLSHNKDVLGMSQALENERKKQEAQRELLDLKEDSSALNQDSDEPNPDLALNTQSRREKIARLFSVTRYLARNYTASNNAKAAAQKNFGIFSHTKQQITATKTAQTHQANTDKALSTKTSTLFSQQSATHESNETEQLTHAIRQGQKIFHE